MPVYPATESCPGLLVDSLIQLAFLFGSRFVNRPKGTKLGCSLTSTHIHIHTHIHTIHMYKCQRLRTTTHHHAPQSTTHCRSGNHCGCATLQLDTKTSLHKCTLFGGKLKPKRWMSFDSFSRMRHTNPCQCQSWSQNHSQQHSQNHSQDQSHSCSQSQSQSYTKHRRAKAKAKKIKTIKIYGSDSSLTWLHPEAMSHLLSTAVSL